MSKLAWCPNCQQNVEGQDVPGVSAAAPLVLLLIGIVLLFVFWPIGAVVLFAGGVVALVRIIEGICAIGKPKLFCPICKSTGLLEGKR